MVLAYNLSRTFRALVGGFKASTISAIVKKVENMDDQVSNIHNNNNNPAWALSLVIWTPI